MPPAKTISSSRVSFLVSFEKNSWCFWGGVCGFVGEAKILADRLDDGVGEGGRAELNYFLARQKVFDAMSVALAFKFGHLRNKPMDFSCTVER